MNLPVTTFFAGLSGLLMLTLAARVILLRRSAGIGWGDGGNRALTQRIRAFGNAAEYTPIGLILLGLLEAGGSLPQGLLATLGALFLAGRVVHGAAFSFAGAPMRPRVLGTALTLIALGLLSLLALWAAFQGQTGP
jgi:uncharacterized membrane protein YecN with MAPEG domain